MKQLLASVARTERQFTLVYLAHLVLVGAFL